MPAPSAFGKLKLGPGFRIRRAEGRRPARARVPTVLQMEALECGAACLGMILAHHGRHVPLEELRVACGVSRDGSKASNMLKAARAYGLEAKGYKREPEQLKSMPVPMIVHWNFNHFVVLEGFRKGRAYLNDPAQGPTRVSEEELDQAFTGVAMVFEPGPAFERGGRRPGLLGALAPRLSGSVAALAYVLLAGLALTLPGIVAPTFSRVFVDDVLVKGLTAWLRPLLLMMAAAAVVQVALTWLQQRALIRLETRLALKTSGVFFWHVLRLPIVFFTQRYAGEIGNRVGISDRVAKLLSGELASTVLSLVMVAFYAVLMVQYDLLLTGVSVGIALLNLAALRYMSRTRVDLNQRLLQDRGKMMGVAMGGLQTIETLKATGSESDFFARWSGYQAKVVNAGQQLGLATQLLSAVPPFLLALNTALVLGVGGMRVMDGHLSMGMLMAFQALMLAFVAPVNRMVALGSTLQEVQGDMNRLDDVLRAPPDPALPASADESDASSSSTAVDRRNGGVSADVFTGVSVDGPPVGAGFRSTGDGTGGVGTMPCVDPTLAIDRPKVPAVRVKLTGALELRDVTFGYSRLDAPLISGFGLVLRPGSRVALVGGSGCGKSTIARLVAGLYEPWSGEILFDGMPRQEIPRQVLSSSLAVVDQDIFLFENGVRENLTMWDGTVPEADLLAAARDACIHDEIASRAGGYAGRVDEGGANFSGGQRQRMEIARALTGNPSLLVLDEATSALDAATEKEIDDNLRRRGCTCLLVAHRLSTIRDCDEIIVLDRGKIVQRGTHRDMAAVDGPYARLIALE